MEDYLINMGASVVKITFALTIKNPKSKAKYRRMMLKILTSIKTAFADDPDFA